MDALNRETLVAARQWRDAGYGVVLATVTHTWGSSPRPVGSMLAVRKDGLLRGSVSGGCIEDDLIHRMTHGGLALSAPQSVSYGVDADEAHQYGLPCGGTLELLLEPLLDAGWITRVLDACACGSRVARELDLKTGAVRIRSAESDEGLAVSADTLTAVYGPRYRLLIIGAGDMSAFLAQIALKLDYDVTICDPRVEYTAEFDVPGVAVVDTMPDDTVVAMNPDSHTAIVTLTHDPKLDDLALMEALKSDAFYVGAIGSRRNNDNRRDRLALFDVSREQLQRLRGPVGLPIGSKTPFEIAISIAAELTAVKNGVPISDGRSRYPAVSRSSG
ncbi:XdhC family protein [Parapusillimonas sp. SGNA-6]|nr:XdhC family protein [Parapusillimonas sp. SGNA-6]